MAPKVEYKPLTKLQDKANQLREELINQTSEYESSLQRKTASFRLPDSDKNGSRRSMGKSMNSRSPIKSGRSNVDIPLTSSMKSGRSATRQSAESLAAAVMKQADLEEAVASRQSRIEELEQDISKRQASYLRREDELLKRVEELDEQLKIAKGEQMPTRSALGKLSDDIRDLHGQVTSRVEDLLQMQEATFRIQERDTLRQFASKLEDLEKREAAERMVSEKGEREWFEGNLELRRQLDHAHGTATLIDKQYRLLKEEGRKFKAEAELNASDREFLIKQGVNLKRENQELR
eukprot:CAMPEP_0175071980 /NCGR_PEP_ID=MMETSP0052_2-20121109/19604_1 /TAXON_ID=51329 ORGANISM="Polytomella parva, Strain SAG 63-3" /NCGR_SAMPLE_ID=MMETSP0052_2 /ASSEMBLY_ACC=CAM_ASM_000194 /LENGTH=291 /DNA_ID=CAMNT_0016339331 /DNA_START=71 /DNA_END=943 /DNA_ORIENTATION=+